MNYIRLFRHKQAGVGRQAWSKDEESPREAQADRQPFAVTLRWGACLASDCLGERTITPSGRTFPAAITADQLPYLLTKVWPDRRALSEFIFIDDICGPPRTLYQTMP